MPTFERVVARLREAVADPDQLVPAFKELEALAYSDEAEYQRLPEPVQEIIADLAYDLDYYEPNPDWRREDPSFYGPERAVKEIEAALSRLRAVGAV